MRRPFSIAIGARARSRRAFTLIEVMFAVLLMGVVGLAISGFLSAFAAGTDARANMNDPAIESTLATRRLTMLAPGFCWVLQSNPGSAAIWLSDTVPSRSVHLSELGLVRFDETTGELVYEFVDPAFLRESYKLNAELPLSSTDYIALMDEQRNEDRLLRHILAEGIDEVVITTSGVPEGQARISVTIDGFSAAISLSPPFLEEPLQ
ncbi:MAG: hypothetical protein GC172_12200 [Phycisphaera sp.]|nr:hypothetical protein [Phycisphaera sp.]